MYVIEYMEVCLHGFLKIAMGLWFYEDDAVKQLFGHNVLVLVVRIRNLLQLDVCLPVDRGLSIRGRPNMLMIERGKKSGSSVT